MAAESHREVIQRDQRKRAESPEDEGMRQPWQGPLADYLGLADHFPKEIPRPPADRSDGKVGIFLCGQDPPQHLIEAAPE